jgi:hypothetical protein
VRAHALNALFVELMRSEEALALYQRDPDALARRHGLTDEERERVKARDMGWLYVHGVHPYILVQFALSIGYDMGTYATQVREATGYSGATP